MFFDQCHFRLLLFMFEGVYVLAVAVFMLLETNNTQYQLCSVRYTGRLTSFFTVIPRHEAIKGTVRPPGGGWVRFRARAFFSYRQKNEHFGKKLI
jgi:hypothetical protein